MRPKKTKEKKSRRKTATKDATLKKVHRTQEVIIPGEIILGQGDILAFEGRQIVELTVANRGDRPIQVGSHCHFFEANRALQFDRERAFGYRLRIPSGTAVRFEPGEEKHVTLVAIGGNRVAYGINGLTNGSLDDPGVRERALEKAEALGFIAKGMSK